MPKIALLGAQGGGMRGLQKIMQARGAKIVAADARLLGSEEAMARQLPTVDLVVHTDAISAAHPLIQQARAAGVPTRIYHEALGEVAREYRTLAVTGTHGKSSTTSMLAHIFSGAGFDPTALVGAPVPAWNGENARVGQGEFFIVEADEYRNHFLALAPESAVITTIDFDHPDFFTSLADTEQSYARFVQQISAAGVLLVPTQELERHTNIAWPVHTRAVSEPAEQIELVLPGRHMQYNAWLAIQLARFYDISETTARAALRTWPGLGRRFEKLGQRGLMQIISDYGHHPQEIVATIAAARERYPTQKIAVLFEPHTQERVREFGEAFVRALGGADAVFVAPVFIPPGREEDHVDALELQKNLVGMLRAGGTTATLVSALADIDSVLNEARTRWEVMIVFSAGVVDTVIRELVV